MRKTAFDTKTLTIDPVYVTIAGHHAHQFTTALPQGHLAAVRAKIAGGDRLRQFPWPGLVPVSGIKQSAGGTNFNTVATLGAIEPAHVRADDCVCTAPAGFDCVFSHPFIADPGAA